MQHNYHILADTPALRLKYVFFSYNSPNYNWVKLQLFENPDRAASELFYCASGECNQNQCSSIWFELWSDLKPELRLRLQVTTGVRTIGEFAA